MSKETLMISQEKHNVRDRERQRDRQRETDRERNRQTDREAEADRHRKERERDRQTQRGTDRHRETDRESWRSTSGCYSLFQVWVLIIMFGSKRFKRIPHQFLVCLILSHVSTQSWRSSEFSH